MATPARTATKVRKPNPDSDIEVLSHDEEGGSIRARVFGEEFTLADDVNALLLMEIGDEDTGGAGAVMRVIKSLLMVDPDLLAESKDDDEREQVRLTEWKRFRDHVGRQRGFSVERLMKLINDIAEVAGKDQPDSSGS